MANPIPPIPLRTPLVDDSGMMTTPWVAWFREIFTRVGGIDASSITQLSADIADLDERVTALE